MQAKTSYGIIAVLVALLVIVSGVASLYYYQYSRAESENLTYVEQLKAQGVTYTTDVLIGYGNSTWKWYNDTQIPVGSNLYAATLSALKGNVNSTCCEYNSHFITGIGGVQSTSTEYWWLWLYTPTNSSAPWQVAPLGPDELPILNDSVVFSWTLCGSTAAGNLTCTPV